LRLPLQAKSCDFYSDQLNGQADRDGLLESFPLCAHVSCSTDAGETTFTATDDFVNPAWPLLKSGFGPTPPCFDRSRFAL